jgi:hypothetical protein
MPQPGALYVMDRGYIDFQRLFVFTLSGAFLVVRTKSNVLLQRRYSHPVDKSTGVRSDQTVILSSFGFPRKRPFYAPFRPSAPTPISPKTSIN